MYLFDKLICVLAKIRQLKLAPQLATNYGFFPLVTNHAAIPANAFITDVNFPDRFDYSNSGRADNSSNVRPMYVMMLGLRGFPNVQGGVETHAEYLAPLLTKLGCNIEVIVRSPYQKTRVGKHWRGVKFANLWAPQSKMFEALVHTFIGVIYAAFKRPDILHIHAVGPAIMTPLARLLGLKVIVTHHGPDYNRQKWGPLARNTLKLGEWLGMRFSNGRIVISNVIRELVLSKHTKNSELICNGVVMPDLNISDSFIKQFGLEKEKYILLVSRLVPEKRHLDLVEAFNSANLTGYKLVFVGASDHPDAYVISLFDAASNNPNIVMTGFQTGDALRSLYAHAALFVLPSSHEGLSISLLEALSYGLPIVASNIPANLELGLDLNCYYELGRIDELAVLLKQNIENPVNDFTRADLREWVSENYNWGKVAEKTFKEYKNIITKEIE